MILYSSGYSLNFKSTEIKNSITIKADTIPRGASVTINNNQPATTPSEITTADTGPLNIKIEKPQYLSETFLAIQENQQNSFADLTSLWLLPETASVQTSSAVSPIPKTTLNNQVISESQTLVEFSANNKTNLGILDFGIGGKVGDVQPISTAVIIGGKSIIDPELNANIKNKLLDKTQEFKKIGNDLFFKNNIILIRKNGYWLGRDLDRNILKAQDIARINGTSIAILDQNKNLWVYNIETELSRFIDTGFTKMKTLSTPSTIWLWKKDTIYRLEPADILADNLLIHKYEYLKNSIVESESGKTFDVQNLYQGIAIQTGRYMFYVPDFKRNQWQVVSSNVFSIATLNETAVWLDSDKNLFIKNYANENVKNIAQNVDLTDKIAYSEGWKRVMVYYPTMVKSIWFNKDVINSTIKTYAVQNWIQDQKCFPKIVDRVQYCIKEGELKIYKNNNLF
jgi:PEGA domain